jgi:hypothetical protein
MTSVIGAPVIAPLADRAYAGNSQLVAARLVRRRDGGQRAPWPTALAR